MKYYNKIYTIIYKFNFLSKIIYIKRSLLNKKAMYDYIKIGMTLEYVKTGTNVFLINLVTEKDTLEIGHYSLVELSGCKQISLSLSIKGINYDTFKKYNFSRLGISKGIYDYIINEHDPDEFYSTYIEDNKKVFMHYRYTRHENFVPSCLATPNGKVVSRRNFNIDTVRSLEVSYGTAKVIWIK